MQDKSAQPTAERFTTTALGGKNIENALDSTAPAPDNLEGVGKAVVALFEDYKSARSEKEEMWLEAWAEYLGTPQAIEGMRNRVGSIIGDTNNDWRHRISTGKAYELVETMVGYLMGAFFPNSEWFDVISDHEPGLEDVAKVTRKYVAKKLMMAQFRSYWEMYTRQCMITGFSVMALPWERREEVVMRRQEVQTPVPDTLMGGVSEMTSYPASGATENTYDNVALDVIDCFDVFLDPNARDVNFANLVRIIRMTKAQLMRSVATGEFPHLDGAAVAHAGKVSTNAEKARMVGEYMGIRYDPRELIEVLDFWGDITVDDVTYHDVHIVSVGHALAQMEPNPYWGGRPFIIGTAIPVPSRVYGLGPLEPVLGLLHHSNSIMNQRADNMELAVDTMWGVVNDGVTNPDDIYSEPGKLIEMAEAGNVFPIQKDTTFTITYTEQQVLEQTIDRTVGAGVGITTGQGRKGERVTAQEIQAVMDAGGNRLSNIHGHMEDTQLHILLVKMVQMCRQFITKDEVVRLPGEDPGSVMYVQYGPRELMYDYELRPVGAEYVANRERELQQAVDYVNLVSQVPQFSEQINWEAMLRMVTRKFGFKEDPETFLNAAPTAPPAAALPPGQDPNAMPMPDPNATGASQDPMQAAQQAAMASGGLPMVNAMGGMAQQAGGEEALLAQLMNSEKQ